jgi:AraC-like DNA-binding protein
MKSAGPDISIGEIARDLRISLRSLELGFREARNMTPTQVHRQFRLEAARQALLDPKETTTVTSVAVTFGFLHLARFSQYYQSMFNEVPSQTLRRSKARGWSRKAAVSGVYCPHDVKVLESNRGIDAVLEARPGSRQQTVSLRYSAPV